MFGERRRTAIGGRAGARPQAYSAVVFFSGSSTSNSARK